MAHKSFTGREIDWLMGRDEDNPFDGVVQEKALPGTEGGYQMNEVVVRHPDGHFYQFIDYYDDDHGMRWCNEDPDKAFPATEVARIEVTTYEYVPVTK